METLEFLGGKYQKTEQIVPGPVQTFRAREAASGRDVFVHRVSTTEEAAEQMALLRMLTTVLLRSPEARRLVLDFGDDQGFWYVVTQSEPRCLILREWLQFELNRSDNTPVPSKQMQGAPAISSPPPASKPEPLSPKPEETAPGEFTKLFQTTRPASLKESSAPGLSSSSTLPEKIATTPAPPAQSEPGEFTRVFQSLKPPPAQPTPVTSPAAQAPKDEQGEFTKLFHGGLPSAGKPPSNPEIKRSQDRPSRGGFVQRPNTPMPPLPQKSPAEPGEFTRIFSHPVPQTQKPKDVFADYPISSANSRDLFSGGDLPKPKTPEAREPGEYTRIFGGGKVSPPIEQPLPAPPKALNPTPIPLDDPLQGTRHFSPAPAAPPPVQKGPSEYTMVIHGNRPLQDAPAGNASPTAGSAPPPAAPALPKVPPPPQLKLPQVSVPKPPAAPAFAQVKGPTTAGNKKLVVFFTILAVLAVVLILLVVLIAVKK